tara:strand:+ start:170 stop:1033 length:864 start_codon:yes stop_codon:yes gene_type:complete
MNYTIPKNLLSTKNSKTIKGEKLGYTTYIMYLAPHKQNSKGKNLCSHASVGCADACLFGSGAARFDAVQAGKTNKTEYFLAARKEFMLHLYKEIKNIVAKHDAVQGDEQLSFNGSVLRYKKFAIRLNGTSDIPFENLKVIGNKNIFELFPNVIFYDYTKNHTRFTNKVLPTNYHITFSRSEDNHIEVVSALQRGFNVAIVFGVKDEADMPKTYLGYKVINGDESDLRFLDDENVVVGLKYKYLTGKGTKGKNKIMLDSNSFIVNVDDIPVQDQALIGAIAYDKVMAN